MTRETNNVMDISEDPNLKSVDIEDILDNALNVGELLQDDHLDQIGEQVLQDFNIDRDTMADWLKGIEDGIKLASQMVESKTEPWPGAANIKHALILEACIQFSARALPEIIRDDKIVKPKKFGKDPQKVKFERAMRVATFMNWQLLEGMETWEEDLDRLLMVLSMVGTVFKKSYYCPVERENKSELCLPDKITINQNVKNLKQCRRITHEIELFPSQIEERKRTGVTGVFLDVELDEEFNGEESYNDQPHIFFEQHRYLDLDGDGYPEPYIVTVHETSKKVVRITPNFSEEDISFVYDDSGNYQVTSILRGNYFSDFHFIHAIDGTYFSYGFGYLLSHATNTINTLLNQLIDAGSLDNLQSGFIGKGARIKGGQISFKPGKWVKSDSSGGDLKNSIVPLPTKGPSTVLLSLVQFLLQSYYKMISLSDIMSGQVSGSNTTAAEAMQAVEQGMKVMNSIYKRVYRGLKKELKQLYLLNRDYVTQEAYVNVLDDPEANVSADFENLKADITPVADAAMSSQIEEVMKLRSAIEMQQHIPEMQRIPLGRRWLTAMRIEDVDEILPPVDPNKPSPQQQQYAEELNQLADELNFRDREVRVKEGELMLKQVELQYKAAKMVAETQKLLQQTNVEGASISIKAIEAQAKSLAAEAAYIQAITPDSGASKNDSKQGAGD
jgi:chaperonin GroES